MAYINEENQKNPEFKRRLIKLMKKEKIKNAYVLAERIYDTGLIVTRQNNVVRQIKVSSIEKTIQKHMSETYDDEKLPNSLSANYLKAYSMVLKCSTDYLIGNTDIVSPIITVQSICEQTNLSEEAINILLEETSDKPTIYYLEETICPFSKNTLNSFLTSKSFATILNYISSFQIDHPYFNSFDKNYHLNKLANSIGEERMNNAIYWENTLTHYYDGPEPSKEEINDLKDFSMALDKDYENNENYEKEMKSLKFELFEEYQKLINELLPSND